MSDNFRIFVTEKEIVIRKFTIKTPRRWAKRQRDMRNIRMNENTIKDLGTLNRGQSMLLNLYIKSYTHVTLHVYTYYIELTVYAPTKTDLEIAELILRNSWGDGDGLEYQEFTDSEHPYVTLQWKGMLLETENE